MSSPGLEALRIDRAASGRSKTRRWRRWLLAAALVLIVAALVGRGLSEPNVETVTVGSAYPYQGLTLLNAAGYVVAQRKAAIASKASGRLEWLGVVEGSVVKRGEVIARIENQDVAASLAQARANVAVARAGINQAQAEVTDAAAANRRTQDLAAQKYLSASAVDAAQARYLKASAAEASARAALAAAQANANVAEVALAQTLIRAPFNGIVLTKNANVGDTVTPFSSSLDTKGAVVTVADMDTLEVEADVSEANLQKIRVDQPCEIQLDAFPEQRFRGVVSRLVPTVDRAKATVMTKVRFVDFDPGQGLRILPEMSAKVAFLSQAVAPEQRRPRTVVNPLALAKRDGKNVVFVVSEGRVRMVEVTSAETLGEALVVSGVATALRAGDKLVLKPDDKLVDGMAVKQVAKQ